jgi:hypothetical protein
MATLAVAIVVTAGSSFAQASTYSCQEGVPPGQAPAPRPTSSRLLFGIFPGGSAGAILPGGVTVPDNPGKDLAALGQLAGSHPFVLHEYVAFTGVPGADEQALQGARSYLAQMGTDGFFSELVVRYAPANGGGASAVSAYVRFIRHVVDVLGPNPKFLDLQVTNEANFAYAGTTSDGTFTGVKDALIDGVEAAKNEAQLDGFPDLKIGFNWFYRTDPNTEDSFWTYLGTHGGAAFDRAVDWVGLDAYPGTFFPPAPADERDAMINAMSVLRDCFMRAAGLGARVQIHVVENGWPTGPGRPEALQTTALQDMIGAVEDYRANYGVTDYRWFDLRDADSGGADFEEHYGLEDDNYSPKPAFYAYQSLISSLDTQSNPTRLLPKPPRETVTIKLSLRSVRHTCSSRSARIRIALRGPIQLRSLVVYVDGRRRTLHMRGEHRRFFVRLHGHGPVTIIVYARTMDGHLYKRQRKFASCTAVQPTSRS